MADSILTVLDKQTAQAETLIARLQERLEQTNQLREMEQQRRQVETNIERLAERLTNVDSELAELRQFAVEEADLDAAAAQLKAALTASGQQPQAPAIPPAPAPTPATSQAQAIPPAPAPTPAASQAPAIPPAPAPTPATSQAPAIPPAPAPTPAASQAPAIPPAPSISDTDAGWLDEEKGEEAKEGHTFLSAATTLDEAAPVPATFAPTPDDDETVLEGDDIAGLFKDFGGSDLGNVPDDFSFDGGLFSAAEDLSDDSEESPEDWSWWGTDAEPGSSDPGDTNPDGAGDFSSTGLYGEEIGADDGFSAMPAAGQTEAESSPRKGILGRFFS